MQKIISVFQRNYDGDRLIRDEVVPGAEWVLAGEGIATRKYDGTCCLVRGGRLYKRYEARLKNPQGAGAVQTQPGAAWEYAGKPPAGFEPAGDPDPVTLKQQGWVPVGSGPEDRWHRETFVVFAGCKDGTYELIGPKVQGNPEACTMHMLIAHGRDELPGCPRTFGDLKQWLAHLDIEGVVFHHPDGRMAKVKKRDFGLPRKPVADQKAA
jgi:hypothetical protein